MEPEPVLEPDHVAADRAPGDEKRVSSGREAAMAPDRLEGTQGVER